MLNGYPDGCGWFCRRLHDLSSVVEVVAPRIHTVLKKALATFQINIDDFAFRQSDLSLQDQEILDNWYFTKFEVWSKKVSEAINFISIQRTEADKLTLINDLYAQICLVNAYHTALNIPFLTINGKLEMLRLIEEFSKAIIQELSSELSKLNVIENQTTLDFKIINPIITEKIKGVDSYRCSQFILRTTKPIDIVSDVLPVETTPVATTMQQSKTTGLNWILYALAGFGIYKAVTKK